MFLVDSDSTKRGSSGLWHHRSATRRHHATHLWGLGSDDGKRCGVALWGKCDPPPPQSLRFPRCCACSPSAVLRSIQVETGLFLFFLYSEKSAGLGGRIAVN